MSLVIQMKCYILDTKGLPLQPHIQKCNCEFSELPNELLYSVVGTVAYKNVSSDTTLYLYRRSFFEYYSRQKVLISRLFDGFLSVGTNEKGFGIFLVLFSHYTEFKKSIEALPDDVNRNDAEYAPPDSYLRLCVKVYPQTGEQPICLSVRQRGNY